MLNPFPDLLTYAIIAPFLIRVVAGVVFIDLGGLLFRGEKGQFANTFKILKIPDPQKAVKILGTLEIVGGISLVIGIYTQISALILSLITLTEIYIEYKNPTILKRSLVFYILLFVMTLSLLFTGAGAFAVDIPL